PRGERLELIEGALAAIRSWITRHPTRVERCEVAPSEPVDGGAALARILGAMRDLGRTPGGRAKAARQTPPMETAVIIEGARTPIGRFLGSFADTPAVELGRLAAQEAMRRAEIAPQLIDQTILGHARQAGNGPNTGRQVSVRSGVPIDVAAYNVNMACGSGMKAVQLAAQQIALGDADVVLAGGMENMSRVPHLFPQMRRGHRLGDTRIVDA